jgi:hypothetical protein
MSYSYADSKVVGYVHQRAVRYAGGVAAVRTSSEKNHPASQKKVRIVYHIPIARRCDLPVATLLDTRYTRLLLVSVDELSSHPLP